MPPLFFVAILARGAHVATEGRATVCRMGETGTVHSINTSGGGVPKLPRPEASITADGLTGDRQRDRRYHGGPMRAVSLLADAMADITSSDAAKQAILMRPILTPQCDFNHQRR